MPLFNFVKQLILANQISFEEGEIKLLGQNMAMSPLSFYSTLLTELRKAQPEKYSDIIYAVAKESSNRHSKAVKEKFKMDARKQTEFDLNTLALAGLGKGELIEFDAVNKKALVKVTDSHIAKALHPSDAAVDFLIAGFLAGSAASAFAAENIECREIKCRAKGDAFCLFRIFMKE